MPTYVYQEILPDGKEGELFEVVQSMDEPVLTQHPETGNEVQRVYQPPNISSKYTPGGTARLLENKNVEKAGFTKYEKDKLTGSYHRVAGKEGPDTLTP